MRRIRRNNKSEKMIVGLWFGFFTFAGIVLVVFWIFFRFFLAAYQNQVAEELQSAAWSVWANYGEEDFEANISFLAKTNGYFVQIISEEDNELILSVNNQGESAQPQQEDIIDGDLFQKMDETGGILSYYVQDETHSTRWAVQAMVLANIDGKRQVLVISCSLADADVLQAMLYGRYWIIAAMVLLSASLVSILLAQHFSKPFQHLNKSALRMAEGAYDTEFPKEGPEEARQLAQTLELAEEEFNKTEALRRDIMANISHDMKTPLTVIRMYAEMLDSFSGEIPEKRAQHVQMIIDEADKLTEFINDSMELARLQSGTMEMEETVFSISELVEEVVESACKKQPDFVFRIDCDGEMPVRGDRKLIHRVVYNFVTNAMKFSGEKKWATVRVHKWRGSVRVEVIDYGVGISEEDLSLVWNRFYQVRPHDKNKTGMGMGLNIAGEILKMHHAPYGAESTPNEGSCFWFMLEAYDNET